MKPYCLKCSDFSLSHHQPALFWTSQCRMPLVVFLTYRWIVGVYILAIITFNQVYKFNRDPNPFVYLTNWNFMLQAVALCFKAGVATYKGCKRPDYMNIEEWLKMSWYLKMEWVLHNITSCTALVALLYWPQFQTEKEIKMGQPYFLFFTVQTHGLSAVVAVIDVLVGATPIRILHIYQPLLFLVIYYTFTVVYYSATGGKMIYGYLNWGDVGPTLKVVSFYFLFAIICYAAIFFLKALQKAICCPSIKRYGDENKPLLDEEWPITYTKKTKEETDIY